MKYSTQWIFVNVLIVAAAFVPAIQSAPIFITIDAPPSFIPISDQGPMDLNPKDGVIGFDQTLRYSDGVGSTVIEIKGSVTYIPGVAIPGGQTDFGVSLSNFSAKIISDTPGTQSVPLIILNIEGTFSPGVPAADLGDITDHIDGSITFDAAAGKRAFVTDLSTWTGVPQVSAGHAEIPVISQGEGIPVPFSFPDITSPLASGALDTEIVHYQLNLPRCLDHNGICTEFDLPGSAVALVVATPEPGGITLLGIGGLLLLGYGFRSRAVPSSRS